MTERIHKPYHERQLNQQVLDALLRIEEILDRAFPAPAEEEQLSMSQFASKGDLEAAKANQRKPRGGKKD